MTRRQALAKARAVRAAKRAAQNGHLDLHLPRADARYLFDLLSEAGGDRAMRLRGQILDQVFTTSTSE